MPEECKKLVADCAYVFLYFLGVVLMGIAATIPCYIMCCCTVNPVRTRPCRRP